MSVTTFLSNKSLWQTLAAKVKAARRVDAAVAYFGKDGARLLPLRRGDRLVVDMSLSSVRAGRTSPHEVAKLILRGVQAFSRRDLHAKIVVTERFLIAGSANVSRNSQLVLDEAAIITTERSAIRRAREFVDRLCTEPVRPEYLKKCEDLYKPPRFNRERKEGTPHQRRVTHAKLWIVNLRESSVPEREIRRYERGETKAQELIKDTAHSTLNSFHWPYKPRMASELAFGDWLIQVVKWKDKTVKVYPPGQLLLMDCYTRDRESGKKRYVFHLEIPTHGRSMTWSRFRQAARLYVRLDKSASPRTMPVRDVQGADHLLSLWTPRGQISRRRPKPLPLARDGRAKSKRLPR